MRRTLLSTILLMIVHFSYSQHTEVGIFLGLSSYEGDLNQRDLFLPTELHPSIGIEVKKVKSEAFSYGAMFNIGKLTGDDQNFEDRLNFDPNLSFSSSVNEFILHINWAPILQRKMKFYNADTAKISFDMEQFIEEPYAIYTERGMKLKVDTTHHVFIGKDSNGLTYIYDGKGHYKTYNEQGELVSSHYRKRFAPYIMTGLGVSMTNPDPKVLDLVTNTYSDFDGGVSYGNTHLTIPMGGGLLYDFSPKFSVAVEAAYRYPFSDYIDGVSEGRDPEDKDWYLFFGARGNYKFGEVDKDYYHLINKM